MRRVSSLLFAVSALALPASATVLEGTVKTERGQPHARGRGPGVEGVDARRTGQARDQEGGGQDDRDDHGLALIHASGGSF